MDEEGLIPCVDGEYCHLIVARVLCGKSMRAPEPWSEQDRIKPGAARAMLGDEYDSVEGGPHRPARAGAGENDSVIYVVYKSSQALAEFVYLQGNAYNSFGYGQYLCVSSTLHIVFSTLHLADRP